MMGTYSLNAPGLIFHRHSIVGCAFAIDSDGIRGTSGKYRLGVFKFFLPKWNRYFVHLFSPEEGVTEFATLPKALKYVKSCNSHDDEIQVDFSRLCKDRFWVGQTDLVHFQLLSDTSVWSRPNPRESLSQTTGEWK